jgi:hypothetical protein
MYNEAEYEALRATIRERGSVRVCVILAGVIAWGALILALNATDLERAASLVPLLVLVATFEISFFIHTGVERLGRYLQVFYEDTQNTEPKGWENTVMTYGRNNPGGPDPLFRTLFALVTAINFLGSFSTAARHPGWIGISLVAHLIFGWRLVHTSRFAASQRALDLQRFLAIKNSPASN